MKKISCLFALVFFLTAAVAAGATTDAVEDPITKLRDDTMRYFRPMSGQVERVDGKTVVMTIQGEETLLPGMRLKVLREGEPFLHPVTRELLGHVETAVGKVEVADTSGGIITATVVEGDAQKGDKVRISETKVSVFFCQEKKIDWYLADEFYRKLKETERIQMVDTALETDDETLLIEEAGKTGAEVALLLTAQSDEDGTVMRERLYWVSDGGKFLDTNVRLSREYSEDLKVGEAFFAPGRSDPMLTYDMHLGARLLAAGDFNGDGDDEVALSTGKKIMIFVPAVDLQPLWEFETGRLDEHVWIGAADVNGNGKDEIIVTSVMEGKITTDSEEARERTEGGAVVSRIFEYDGSGFVQLWETDHFLRTLGKRVFAQRFSSVDGYEGSVFAARWKGDYELGDPVDLPEGVNVYDFAPFGGAGDERLVLAYDDAGHLNLYNDSGVKTWRSESTTGGFIRTYKKKSRVMYLEPGEWAVKDRLIVRNRRVLVIERIPIAKMAQAVGYKNSQIRMYWWNGVTMEQELFLDDIPGTLLDIAVVNDRIYVLTSPLLGIKFRNILKGENPFGSTLFVYSLKGG